MLDPEGPGQYPGGLESRGPIPGDALVDAESHHADGRAAAEVPLGESEGDPAVLPARERHRHGPPGESGQLAVHFAADPVLDRLPEVRGAQVSAPIRLVDDGLGLARGAAHGRTQRSRSI